MSCGSLDKRGVWGRMDTCVSMADPFTVHLKLAQHCLLIGCISVKKSLSRDYIHRCNKIEIIMKLRKSETKPKIAQSWRSYLKWSAQLWDADQKSPELQVFLKLKQEENMPTDINKSASLQQAFSASVLLTFWTKKFYVVGSVQSIVRSLAASLVSTHDIPVTPLPTPHG